ncbi:MAG: penicillin-binding protein [Candidatus Gracilibacteria bacterium]|nr:penicillin-binding protein [Candidatus Gracilibacteria bacterium]
MNNRNRYKSTNFIKYKIRKSRFNIKNKLKDKEKVKRYVIFGIMGLVGLFFFSLLYVYIAYILPLPDVKNLEKLNLAKSSIIYDKDGNELYKIYKENRTYVNYDNISKNMTNALVAGEDKTFLQNSGVDFKRMIGAFVYYILGKTDKVEGTSTITQQLIRNTLIGNERKIERKIKEMYLSYKVSSSLSKEKILELYLNKIDFGSNSFGIEEASKTFFGKSAKDLGILEASILASLPKGPTYYSPYTHSDRLLGYLSAYNKEDTKTQTKILSEKEKILYANTVNIFLKYIEELKSKKISDSSVMICGLNKYYHKKGTITIDKDGCSVLEYSKLLGFLNSIEIEDDNNVVEYYTGRKDFILQRMLEDGYIEFDDYKKAIVNSIGFKFEKSKENIVAAHFVLYIKEYLEKKYGKEFLDSGGLKIYTTIDGNLQKKAEELITSYGESNARKFDANNEALISIDNKSGDILAMVGGRDYFDEEIGGNVNMITSKLQPGSSFKPIVYAQAIDYNTIGSKTPVFDLQTTFPGDYSPSNFDGKFYGLMNISTALNNSRNIPAIKMVYLGGGEKSIVKFANKLGFTNIANDGRYGASIGLGTVEVTPLEMASAYTVFANLGVKKEVTPILKILDSKGVVIEEKKATKGEQVIDSSTAYIINSVLSDTSSRPAGWNGYLSLGSRKVAAKTGTSTKQYTKDGKKVKLPRNLWTVGYTPQITTVVRVGNTDGKEVNMSGDGLNAAGPIWRDFMSYAHKNLESVVWKRPSSVKELSISKLTGNPVDSDFVAKLTTTSLFKNVPTEKTTGLKAVKVDALCNGKVSELTPEAGIKDIYVLDIHSLIPTNSSWENPVQKRVANGDYKKEFGELVDSSDIIKDTICDRTEGNPNGAIQIASKVSVGQQLVTGTNYIELAYKGNAPIIKIDILLDRKKVDDIILPGKIEGSYRGNIIIPSEYKGKYDLTLRAVDNNYYSGEETKEVEVISTNNSNTSSSNTNSSSATAPKITIKNPIDKSINLYNNGQEFNLRGEVDDSNGIKTINIYIDGTIIKDGITESSFVYPISGENLSIGSHTIKVEVVDFAGNKGSENISLEILQK